MLIKMRSKSNIYLLRLKYKEIHVGTFYYSSFQFAKEISKQFRLEQLKLVAEFGELKLFICALG